MSGDWLKFKTAAAILLVLSLAVLPGCSLLRIGYGQLDNFAAWTADEYFDLEPEQRREFLARFERLHEWHRYQQLPDYAAFFSETRSRVQKGLSRDDVLWVVEGARERYRVILRRGADDAAALLLTITPAQLAALQRQWDKVNSRFVREYRLDQDTEAQRRERGRRVLSRIRDWVGHLDGAQEQKILALAKDMPLIHGLRHKDRIRRQREFLRLMAQRDAPDFAARLRHWLLNWEEGRDPAYHRLFQEWEQRQADFYLAVYRSLLPHQRAALADRLQSYVSDFTRLARRPEAQAASR
ncbi:MAG: hypothetical protein HYY78_12890 [Betaproteobacteria bacterium]|nr:hypothetical protein [Betaproteobacteria bacterium]